MSSTSRQFLKLLEVIMACITELFMGLAVRRGRGELLDWIGFSNRLLLLLRPVEAPFVEEFSKRLLLLLRPAGDALASSMFER